MPELYEPLRTHVQDAYHPSMNDRVLTLIHSHARDLRFDDAEHLSRWLLAKVESPCYTFRLHCELALFQFHRGQFVPATEHCEAAHAELMARADLMGADDFGRLLSILVNLAADARSPELFRTLSAGLDVGRLATMTAPQRVTVPGARCQFHRFYGEHAEAIAAGREAVALVDLAWASEAGRSRNYLVHAFIASYREGNRDPGLLDEARTILEQASTVWAPVDNPGAYRSHLGFCRHLEAEIARLRGHPFEPGAPLWAGKPWGHPWLFTLLSCARNPRNSADLRKECVQRLLTESAAYVARYTAGSLFGLFDAVFRIYAAVHEGRPQEEARSKLQGWLEEMARQGFPGWKDYLSAFIREEMDVEAAERLCDAIRYF